MTESSLTPATKLALCQRSYTAFSHGPDVDALLALYHPECEWRLGSMGAAFGTEAFDGHRQGGAVRRATASVG